MKLLAYSDGMAVFRTDWESVSKVARLTNTFCEESGAAVIWENSCCFCYGGWDAALDAFEGLRPSRSADVL